jgi:hypothetical protein
LYFNFFSASFCTTISVCGYCHVYQCALLLLLLYYSGNMFRPLFVIYTQFLTLKVKHTISYMLYNCDLDRTFSTVNVAYRFHYSQ